MPSNDERREVAARLRDYESLRETFRESPLCAFLDALGIEGYLDWEDVWGYLAELIEPEERTCLVLHVKHGPLFDVLRFSCCGYEWAENRTDKGATEPDPNYCPNCGARVVD